MVVLAALILLGIVASHSSTFLSLFGHRHKWTTEFKEIVTHFDHPSFGDVKAPIPYKFRSCSCGKVQYQQPRPFGVWKDDTIGLINKKEVYTTQVPHLKH